MPLSGSDIAWGILLPSLIAGFVLFLIGRAGRVSDSAADDSHARDGHGCSPGRWGVAGIALSLGFLAGYFSLELGPWLPESHWHWLPLGALMTGMAALLAGVVPLPRWVKGMAAILLLIVVSWLLVPDWDDLEPAAIWYVLGTACLMWLIAWQHGNVSREGATEPWLLFLAISSAFFAGFVVLALSGSLRFAQMASAGGGAALGMAIVAVARPTQAVSPKSLGLPYAALSVGLMLIGYVNSFSEIPWLSYFLIPLAPLALGRIPLREAEGRPRVFRWSMNLLLVFAIEAIAVGFALYAEWPIELAE